MKIRAIILRNEIEDDHNLWIKACEKFKDEIEFRITDLISDKWLEEIRKEPFDILLAKPGGFTASFKQLYDERIFILWHELGYRIFPSSQEIFIYENKRFLSYWLSAKGIPHPSTHVFYNQKEAISYIKSSKIPLVAKTSIGASGSGVLFLNSYSAALKYISRSFSKQGAPKRSGPNLAKREWLKRGMHYLFTPGDIKKKISIYKANKADVQRGFVIFQEYIPHNFEWRAVRIGDSFFAHKKLKVGDKASGTLLKVYDNPPLDLFDFVKNITDKYDFYSLAIDIFKNPEGEGFLVNEMQCLFGQSDPYQMKIDGKEGRYRFLNGNWVFEEGCFTKLESYELRIKYVIDKFNHERANIK
jgi:hypothetical protein